MRKRVALIATCACLACMIVFSVVFARASLNSITESERSDLLCMCRLSASILDKTALADLSDTARGLAREAQILLEVTGADGETAYSSTRVFPAGDAVTAALLAEEATAIDEKYIYAARSLAGGGSLRVWRARPTYANVASGHKFALLLVALAQLAACYIIVRLAMNNNEAFVRDVSGLLDAYADGRLDARVEAHGAYDMMIAAEINDKAARIQSDFERESRYTQALSTVLNYMENGILAVDDKLNIILMTASAKRLLSISGAHDGMPVREASKDVNIEAYLQEAMGREGIYVNELAIRDGIGRARRPIRLYMSAMIKDGAAIGAVALIEDISELRRLEQARTDFAANVSHELRTPLTSIKGFVETLLEPGALNNTAMAEKFLGIILDEANRLTRLINDILSISKLESGNEEVINERIQLDQMARKANEFLRKHAEQKGITLHSPPEGEPVYVWGNRDRVEQMFVNLIENGVKYNREGGSVTTKVFVSKDSAQVLISDTGIGIEQEHLPRLFERFYRVDKGRSRAMGGTGLGLAIVKHIVMSMGGLIEVHSNYGESTEFLITLPLYKPGEGDEAPAEEVEE